MYPKMDKWKIKMMMMMMMTMMMSKYLDSKQCNRPKGLKLYFFYVSSIHISFFLAAKSMFFFKQLLTFPIPIYL